MVEGVDGLELVGERTLGDQGDCVIRCLCIAESSTMECCTGIVVGVEMRVLAGVLSRSFRLRR